MTTFPDSRGEHDGTLTHLEPPDPLEKFRFEVPAGWGQPSQECLDRLDEIDRNIARSHANAHKMWSN